MNVISAAFSMFVRKYVCPNVGKKKLPKRHSHKKFARKMLMKLTLCPALSVLPEGRDEISPIFCKISPKIFLNQKTAPKSIQTCI